MSERPTHGEDGGTGGRGSEDAVHLASFLPSFISLPASYSLPHPFSFQSAGGLLPERMSKVSGNVVNREPNEAATEGERNL